MAAPVMADREAQALRAIVDDIDAIVWSMDPATRLFTSVSAYAERLLGYPLEYWLTRPNFWNEQVVHPDDRVWTAEFCASATRRREHHSFEYRAISADGRIVWLRDVVRITADGSGAIQLRGVMHDISKAKALEASLRESEQQLRQIAENIPEVIWLADPVTGSVLYINPRYDEVWGRPHEQLYERPRAWLDSVHGDDRARVEASMTERRGSFNGEVRIVRPDGETRWLRVRTFRVLNTDGSAYRIVGIARDVTDAKQAEQAVQEGHQALRQSEARFRSLIENASDMITVLAADGSVRYQSPAIERVLGYAPNERIGASTFEIIHPEDAPRMRDALRRVLQKPGASSVLRARYRHRDGTYRMLEGRGRNLVDDPAVGGIVINTRDITEQAELEAQLRHAQKMEAVGRLAGGVAHDFNNLLSVIQGHSDFLLDGLEVDDPLRDDVEGIRLAAQRAADLTRQLLAFSRKQIMRRTPATVDDLLRGIEKMLRRLIGEDIQLNFQLHATGAQVYIDTGQFEQVIVNLIINARDAMPQGGSITIETDSILRGTTEPDGAGATRRFVRIAVRDTGKGIPEEVLPHIFEPFFTTKDVGQGTGLGLATVYAIIDQCEGTIEVTTAADAGTTFSLFLPVLAAAAPDAPRVTESDVLPRGEETILVVEDETAVRTLACRILQRLGYTVREAANGLEAVQQLEADPGSADLILTDVVMPRMGGLEVAERARTLCPEVPVLFMSGYAEPQLSRQPNNEWPGAFIGKPFTPALLARMVRQTLDARG